jgi:dTDP-4-amino-4,6-dideoxygalactose transaminase
VLDTLQVSHGDRRMEVPFARTVISEEAQVAAARVLASGWVTTGPETVEFEREFADWVGATHAVGVSSCTAGIELALRGLDLAPGAKVLVSTMTFCGAVHAILHAGLTPVLVDVEAPTGMPTPDTTARSAEACGGPDAMLVVHLGGYPAPVGALARAAGLELDMVVEDAAHALGAMVGDQHVGTVSRATCFSFYATKNLPVGEGGMVTTEDAELAARIRRGRLHGMSTDAWRRYLPGGNWRYSVEHPGIKANLTDVLAAIGRAQLAHLESWQELRTRLADRYDERLAGLGTVMRAPRPPRGRHAWHLYSVRVNPWCATGRDALIGELAAKGIGTSVHFIPLHHMPYFRETAVSARQSFSGADALFPRLLSLPLDQGMRERDVDAVCDALVEVSAGRPMTEVTG